MNDTFNINRFWLLAGRQWTENKKVYLLLWGVISLSIMLVIVLQQGDQTRDDLTIFYFWLFWLGGVAMIPGLFSRWSDFGRSSIYLLLPASSIEKILCGIFYGLFLYIPLFGLNFLFIRYIVTYPILLLVPGNHASFSSLIGNGIKEIVSTPFSFYIFSLLTLLFAQSLCMITVIRFKKRQIMVFALILLTIISVYTIGMKMLISWFVQIPPGTVSTPGILLPYFNLGFGYAYIHAQPPVLENFSFIKLIRNLNNLIFLVVFFFLYLSAWYKLKEREL
jgi:hypothetical protein